MADQRGRDGVPQIRLYFKEWRKAAGLTLEESAEKLGISASYLSRIENGKRDFSGRFLAAFVLVVGCPDPVDPICRPPGEPSLDALFSELSDEQRLREKKRYSAMIQLMRGDEPIS